MDEKTISRNEEIEIDLSRLFGALVDKAWLVGIIAILCAVITFMGTLFFVTPLYQASAMFYVNNSSISLGEASVSISSGDISASRGLVKSYIVILNTRETLNDVVDYAGVDRTYSQVKSMISAQAVDNTEIFRVVVTSPDPREAERIANAVAYILPKRIASIIEGSSAKVVDSAVVPSSPSSPNKTKNAMVGFVLGLALSAGFVILRELMDISVHSEDDIAQSCKYPILTSIPDMNGNSKSGGYYGYGKKHVYDKTALKKSKQVVLVGRDISFAASESYKLLRTMLQSSFADGEMCHVIGVSSAMAGEGKSLSAVNLAYSTSQLDKRVLLIDCDMRRPSLADKIPIAKAPGLSDYLTGQVSADKLLQYCGIKDDHQAFHAISSGRTPPNPMELLTSERMERMISHLRKNYDYIILDLPPVGEVGDAIAAASLLDGVLMVVRQDYCNRIALKSALRQFEFVNAKILGIAFNCVTEEGHGYYRKRYYHRYYNRYGGPYSYVPKQITKGTK